VYVEHGKKEARRVLPIATNTNKHRVPRPPSGTKLADADTWPF